MSEEKRKEARKRADRLRAEFKEKNKPLDWFEALYQEADGDPELIPWGGGISASSPEEENSKAQNATKQNSAIHNPALHNPWAHGQARLPLLEWLDRDEQKEWLKASRSKRLALDVGCGLGHNAVALHKAGYQVTAFDISETAVKWAARNAGQFPIEWEAQNLLNMPTNWSQRFDLVSETFTIQALYGEERELAIKALTKLVKPKGKLLIICRGRRDDEIPKTPPLPLMPSELDKIEEYGFVSTFRKDYFDNKTPANLHFVAEFTAESDKE
ncbi:MAG: class I SAM-dependent methyltransferase [Rhodomicrobiaceae bacterium]